MDDVPHPDRSLSFWAYFVGTKSIVLDLDTAPDIERLKGGATQVMVGLGVDSEGQETWDTSTALATRLGVSPVMFPGDHIGMATQPDAFAARLREVLGVA